MVTTVGIPTPWTLIYVTYLHPRDMIMFVGIVMLLLSTLLSYIVKHLIDSVLSYTMFTYIFYYSCMHSTSYPIEKSFDVIVGRLYHPFILVDHHVGRQDCLTCTILSYKILLYVSLVYFPLLWFSLVYQNQTSCFDYRTLVSSRNPQLHQYLMRPSSQFLSLPFRFVVTLYTV